ncbi:MAG: ATP-dependent 6-phosphofructokinase [Bacteroidia bacterium]|nr:ATP-dependent 6-phosphofructokinase [Bacteroidia bacterium]
MSNQEYLIKDLGENKFLSPLKLSKVNNDGIYNYVNSSERILADVHLESIEDSTSKNISLLSLEKAGPHENIFFEPSKTKVAIVTCGGLAPGLNNVIRSLVYELFHRYGVIDIFGILYGYEGLNPKFNHKWIKLTTELVQDIHQKGGSILASSRGNQPIEIMVDTLVTNNINILFCIGGDGTLHGAHEIYKEIEKRRLKIAVAGIPKTIDNDICFMDKTFGFETAYTMASPIIKDAHNEATGAYNGIVVIKLMGRDSGFISAYAALSMQEANFVLVPEIPFDLKGENGLLSALRKRIEQRHHALIVVAEGAGQDLFTDNPVEKDKSGNIKLNDIGIFLKDEIKEYFQSINIPVSIKYIDPSYIIRSAPAIASDSIFCSNLACNAVHAAMAGKTDFVIGNLNGHFILIPISIAINQRKKIDPDSELWFNVLEATGQPNSMKN